MTLIIFLVAFGAFSAQAQTGKDYPDGSVEKDLKKRCDEKTKSYDDFKRCIEMGGGQVCFSDLIIPFPSRCPCRDERDYENLLAKPCHEARSFCDPEPFCAKPVKTLQQAANWCELYPYTPRSVFR